MSPQLKYEKKHREQNKKNVKKYLERHRKIYHLYKQGKLVPTSKAKKLNHIYSLYMNGQLISRDKASKITKQDKLNIQKSNLIVELYNQGQLLTKKQADKQTMIDCNKALNKYDRKNQKYIEFYRKYHK